MPRNTGPAMRNVIAICARLAGRGSPSSAHRVEVHVTSHAQVDLGDQHDGVGALEDVDAYVGRLVVAADRHVAAGGGRARGVAQGHARQTSTGYLPDIRRLSSGFLLTRRERSIPIQRLYSRSRRSQPRRSAKCHAWQQEQQRSTSPSSPQKATTASRVHDHIRMDKPQAPRVHASSDKVWRLRAAAAVGS